MSEPAQQTAVDLDNPNAAPATAVAEPDNDAQVVRLAADRINAVMVASSAAALTGLNKQIEALRELGRTIERRRDVLTDAGTEHARFCHEACRSERIMADAIEELNRSFANGLPPTLRLVDGGK